MRTTRHVYIVLTDTGTLFTRIIRQFTGDPLNHASIAFDAGLEEVYSFGRKYIHIPWIGGFVKENMYDAFFLNAKCAIYRCTLEEKQVQIMRRTIDFMLQNRDRYKYHLTGLVALWLNKKTEREDAYFCSSFVARLFELAGQPLLDKPAYWVKPGDIARSPYVECIFQGTLSEYLHGASSTAATLA